MAGGVPGDIWVETPAARLHARVAGREDGPWLTCLHSLATDLHLWDRQAEPLGKQFRLLLVDMRGHGGSTTYSDRFSIGELRDDVMAIWDRLHIAQSNVLGLSIGGMIALALGLAAPGRVPGIVAADCRADAPPAFRDLWTERQRLVVAGGMQAVVDDTLASWLTPATLERQPAAVQAVTRMITATSREGYLGTTRALQRLSLLPSLEDMEVPVLYLVGAKDGVHPQAMSAMQARTPGSSLRVLPGAAHLSNIEQPARFNAATGAFLRGESVPEVP